MGTSSRPDLWKNGDDSAAKPGPGNYGERAFTDGKSATIGGAYKTKYNNNPGPGQYDADSNKNKRQASAAPMGTSSRPDLWRNPADDSAAKPGPGNYKAELNRTGPSHPFGLKQPEKYNANPGPGQYEANQPASAPNAKIGSSPARKPIINEREVANLPGPGFVDVKLPVSTAPPFNKDVRFPEDKANLPGPADYDL